MSMKALFDQTIQLGEKALNLRAQRHNAILSNIANADTPHYKAFDLLVDEALAQQTAGKGSLEIRRTDPAHLGTPLGGKDQPARPVSVEISPQASLRGDGNTVDMEREMSALADNQLHYKATAQLMGKKFQKIRSVIQGGKV